MATGCLVTSGLLTAAMFFYWFITPTRTLFSEAAIANAPATGTDLSIRALAFGISMVTLGTLIYGFLYARRCFDAFAVGHVFASEPIRFRTCGMISSGAPTRSVKASAGWLRGPGWLSLLLRRARDMPPVRARRPHPPCWRRLSTPKGRSRRGGCADPSKPVSPACRP